MRRKRRFLRRLAIPVDFDHNMTLIAPVPTRAGVLFWSSAPLVNVDTPIDGARQDYDLHRERSVRGVFYFCLGNDMSAIPLTVRGAERLQEELQRLKTVERPAVINAIAEARAQGDLSENAEYDAARERQGFIEGRIAELEGTLSNAHLIDPTALEAEGRAVFGATVDIEDLDSGDRVTYQIVGDVEADIKSNLISVSSPVARALIGKSEGDVVEVVAPAGVREYEVLGVRYI
ncbi:transcription elongation factor GreA [Achromobacter xylosoxidans A8]|uniref:Transcription elongation factor GreA n=2 Tax=Alcaligenaceae TaxID=506 RepID=E3HNV0_ACHXA|nr:transcription elongation factor GreA [Achromobacter xylosoxidans A8]